MAGTSPPRYTVVVEDIETPVAGCRVVALSAGVEIGDMRVHSSGSGALRIATVAVRDDWRQQGVATALFTRALEVYPTTTKVRATAESPEGRVFLESVRDRNPRLDVHFLAEVSSLGDPEPRHDEW